MATLIQLLQNTLASTAPSLPNETRRILLKEALQAFVLDFLYNHPRYRGLNLYGGTCLHVIFELNRLSEDIDLDNSAGIDLSELEFDLSSYIHSTLDYREATAKRQFSRQGILRITLRFPILHALELSPLTTEALHLKLEVSHHPQTAEIKHTPVIFYGRSFVPAHFSLETMMAGKMLACLERSFQKGSTTTKIKGRDWYDLLWFMQRKVAPLEEKLQKDGKQPYSVRAAMQTLNERARQIKPGDLAIDLLPLFERRAYIENWITAFHENFDAFASEYL